MGTNARRKKDRARARRRQENARRGRTRETRARVEGQVAEIQARAAAVQDPGTPPEEAAQALLGLFDGRVPTHGLSRLIDKGGQGRAAAVAEAVLELSPGSVVGLALAADVAEREEQWERAEGLYLEALYRTPAAPDGEWPLEPGSSVGTELSVRLGGCIMERGRVADALDILFNACRDDPGHEGAQQVLAEALARAREHGRTIGAAEPCPCGSGRSHGECCGPREAAALARFEDRSPMYELREALRVFLERPEIDPLLVQGIRDWYLGRPPEEMGDPDEQEVRLAVERALVTMGPRPDDDHYVLLDMFSEDPSTPPELARRAREWRQFAIFGLWEVGETTPDPGLLLQDLVTGRYVHAAVAPEQLEGLPRWSVVLGALLPVEGIWRSGAGFLALTPTEGRALADEALRLGRVLLPHLVPRAVAGPLQRELDGRRKELRSGAPSEDLEPVSPELAHVLDKVVGGAMPALRDLLRELRARPMDVRNTDGEPLELITARVRLRDRMAAEDAMEAHPDFVTHETGWVWYGKPADAATRAMNEAVVGSELEVEEDSGRSVRAFIDADGLERFKVEVNSRGRLDRLLEILRRAGAGPSVESETRIDPALDLPAPGEAVGGAPRPPREHEEELAKLEAEAMAAWRRSWVDEPVPALGGRTPREAASDPEGHPLLEALLRDFEYREQAARTHGAPGHGVEELRRTLGMA